MDGTRWCFLSKASDVNQGKCFKCTWSRRIETCRRSETWTRHTSLHGPLVLENERISVLSQFMGGINVHIEDLLTVSRLVWTIKLYIHGMYQWCKTMHNFQFVIAAVQIAWTDDYVCTVAAMIIRIWNSWQGLELFHVLLSAVGAKRSCSKLKSKDPVQKNKKNISRCVDTILCIEEVNWRLLASFFAQELRAWQLHAVASNQHNAWNN